MSINDYFDRIYVLNLRYRTDRREQTLQKLEHLGIDVEWFDAYDGRLLGPVWWSHQQAFGNKHFKNSNYLACAMSHLAIYKNSLDKGYERILILEDDNAFHGNFDDVWQNISSQVPQDWNNLLYLGWIPVEPDGSRWNYNLLNDKFISTNLVEASNMWGLYAYGIHKNLMEEILREYHALGYPMELDRYFVTNIQPRGKSYGITPQLCAATDGQSDNSGVYETGMLNRSVHYAFAKINEYI